MRYIIFTRVSTDKQKVENQKKECLEYAERAKSTNDEILEFAEPDTSSRIPIEKRPVLQEMMKTAKRGDIVVVYKLDRLAREGQELVNVYCDLVDKGVKIRSIYEPNADKQYVHISAFVAMAERENIRLRTISALNRKKQALERVGTAWYGYTLDQSELSPYKHAKSEGKPYKLVPNDYEQAAISVMLEKYKCGSTYQEIVNALTEKGFVNRQGKKFHKNTIWRILKRLEKESPSPEEAKIR